MHDQRSRLFGDGQELDVARADEHAIVRDERHIEPDRRGGDPPVAVMDFVSQAMAGLLTAVPQLGAATDRRVVRLRDRELCDARSKRRRRSSPQPARSAP